MSEIEDAHTPGSTFAQALGAAARLPGVRIHRASFLRSAFGHHCDAPQMTGLLEFGPAAAGVSQDVIQRAAMTSIKFETSKVTGLSTLAGVPGGFAVLGTVPADLVQNLGHMLRIAQKLAYIHGWPDLMPEDGEELNESTVAILTLFVGVMFGVQTAQAGITKVAELMAQKALRTLPRRALTKGIIYPLVKKVARVLGIEMTKKVFAGGVAKVIPIVGAVLSGGLTLVTFLPMCHRLNKHLTQLALAGTRPLSEDRDASQGDEPE